MLTCEGYDPVSYLISIQRVSAGKSPLPSAHCTQAEMDLADFLESYVCDYWRSNVYNQHCRLRHSSIDFAEGRASYRVLQRIAARLQRLIEDLPRGIRRKLDGVVGNIEISDAHRYHPGQVVFKHTFRRTRGIAVYPLSEGSVAPPLPEAVIALGASCITTNIHPDNAGARQLARAVSVPREVQSYEYRLLEALSDRRLFTGPSISGSVALPTIRAPVLEHRARSSHTSVYHAYGDMLYFSPVELRILGGGFDPHLLFLIDILRVRLGSAGALSAIRVLKDKGHPVVSTLETLVHTIRSTVPEDQLDYTYYIQTSDLLGNLR